MKVYVYFNLHKKCFSIKALEGEHKGLVVAHRTALTLRDVTFKVSEAGRQRVLRERKKNVHAGVVGQWDGYDTATADACSVPVTYNPYKYDSFVYADDRAPIKQAEGALLFNRKIFVNG
jgi:hypothetical protein